MLGYRFKAYDSKGRFHTGNIFLPTEDEVVFFLLRNNLTPIEVKLIPQTALYQFLFKLFFHITFSQKIFLVRNLHLILKSGLSLEKGLEVLMAESKGGLKDFLFYLSYIIQRGEPIYKAFSAFPQAFSPVEIETLKAGEIAGNLIDTLEKWAENLERQRQIRNEITSNLLYPAIVLLLSFGVIVLLITFVMPKIGVLLQELIQEPPFLTKILLDLSLFVNNNLKLVSLFFAFLLIFFTLVLVWRKTRAVFISILIRMPLFSKIYLYLALSQILFVLRSLLKSGISLVQALKLSADSSFHPNVRKAFYETEASLRKGKKLGDALKETDLPIFVSSILGIASETGALEETIKVLEDYYLEEFRNIVRNALNLLQPALLVFVGLVVGFVAIAVIVPIYQQVSSQLQIERGGSAGEIP